MTKRMLIDATHPEETRVAVVDGHRLEEFDFEIAAKKPLKGNIYLAKVTRVEPSLQAAFVDYGGNRHGFLAFSEIHPDYYRIPVADREALLAELDRDFGEGDAEIERPSGRRGRGRSEGRSAPAETARVEERVEAAGNADAPAPAQESSDAAQSPAGDAQDDEDSHSPIEIISEPTEEESARPAPFEALPMVSEAGWSVSSQPISLIEPMDERSAAGAGAALEESGEPARNVVAEVPAVTEIAEIGGEPAAVADIVAGDELEEGRRRRARQIRRYKIQEVVKRRQIMLVQVTKEERGNKGAALTTYLSLAGRYCVLMPNTPRGGGISRKITNPNDRKRLKSIIDELDIPDGIAVIVRTAGSERSKAEIKRDYEYLLRLWDEIRELTLRSTAPALVYEEANLIKRSIRDLYSKDIEDVLVEGEEGYKSAKAFMKMLTPSHAKRVQLYKDLTVPLFHRYQVETQIDAIHQPVVQLKSGGYTVLNQTEALVAIDVNSGRATRERHIEETALKTNLEASDEIARQLRLRDLAGLIVIDFIDMEDQRHNNQVERRLKEALKNDRARIQMGRISHFGLLEMSRQRLRPSLIETSTVVCRHCGGSGHVRSTESTALHLLRAFEEEGIRKRSSEITVSAPTAVALYILNQKREALTAIEQRYGLRILLASDDSLIPPDFRMERTRMRSPEDDRPQPVSPEARHIDAPDLTEEDEEAAEAEASAAEPAEARDEEADEGEERRRRRSRRRRRRRGEETSEARTGAQTPAASEEAMDEADGAEAEGAAEPAPAGESAGAQEGRKRRRRGKRGGRRRRRGEPGQGDAAAGAAFAPDEPRGGDETESTAESTDKAYGVGDAEEPVQPAAASVSVERPWRDDEA
ncbi:MAG TPA: ribonuclease E/G, partial [Alphaproteobacteria bacterium]|nr:ribonuclease E/G [Alphaproteobacteria bacterium]